MPSFSFATFLIVCRKSASTVVNYTATSFFLGILFSLLPYDYPLLWSPGPTSQAHYDLLESHLRLLHASPLLIVRILHIVIFLGLTGLIVKLYKPSESNMLFDGGSLFLYVCGVIVYIANIVKGLRIVTLGEYGDGIAKNRAHGVKVDDGGFDERGTPVLGREDNLKVLSASNTILALVLVGVLVLQAGQWYAERADEREMKKLRAAQGPPSPQQQQGQKGGNGGRGSSKESKKSK
ncbi:MAG: hypothetical protein Q9160_002580 [Pyrenula sp. 1 TL-2023]